MKNRKWLIAPLMYLVMCIYIFFSSTLSVDGMELPRHIAGAWGLVAFHVTALFAVVLVCVLHVIVEALVWITEKLLK